MVQQRSDVPLPFISYTKCLCYEEILMNQVPKQQTTLAVGCDELFKQDNPGRVVRLCLQRHTVCPGWRRPLSRVYCAAQLEVMAPNDCEALTSVKKQVSALLGKSVHNMSQGGFQTHLNCGTCWEGCKATLKTPVCLQRVSNMEPSLLNSTKDAQGNTLKNKKLSRRV